MKHFKFLGLGVLLVALSFSCGKYEEGPGLSLRSKKARIANTWIIEEAITGDQDVTEIFEGYEITFEKDGTWSNPAAGFWLANSGTWELTNDNENFTRTDSDGDVDDAQILKLKEKELWIKSSDDNVEFTIHYKAK